MKEKEGDREERGKAWKVCLIVMQVLACYDGMTVILGDIVTKSEKRSQSWAPPEHATHACPFFPSKPRPEMGEKVSQIYGLFNVMQSCRVLLLWTGRLAPASCRGVVEGGGRRGGGGGGRRGARRSPRN